MVPASYLEQERQRLKPEVEVILDSPQEIVPGDTLVDTVPWPPTEQMSSVNDDDNEGVAVVKDDENEGIAEVQEMAPPDFIALEPIGTTSKAEVDSEEAKKNRRSRSQQKEER